VFFTTPKTNKRYQKRVFKVTFYFCLPRENIPKVLADKGVLHPLLKEIPKQVSGVLIEWFNLSATCFYTCIAIQLIAKSLSGLKQ
jgi:hypothetical protein